MFRHIFGPRDPIQQAFELKGNSNYAVLIRHIVDEEQMSLSHVMKIFLNSPNMNDHINDVSDNESILMLAIEEYKSLKPEIVKKFLSFQKYTSMLSIMIKKRH